MTVTIDSGVTLSPTPEQLSVAVKANPTPRPQIVCTRGYFAYGTVGAGARNDTRFESSLTVATCKSRVGNLQLIYSGLYADADQETANLLTTFTIESAIVQNQIMTPVTFGGRLRPVIDAGATLVISDQIGMSLAPESVIQLRSGAIVAAGGRVPAGVRAGGGSVSTKVASTSATSQIYSTAAVALPAGGANTSTAFTPICVIGVPEVATPSVLIWGDSIPQGFGDNTEFGTGLIGYAERALGTLKIPFVQIGRGGDKTDAYSSNRNFVRFALMQYCSHTFFTCAVNDIGAGTTLEALLAKHRVAWAAAKRAGCKVIVATCTPKTTSTDGWTTLENQTVVAGFGDDELRGQWNDAVHAALQAGEIDILFDVNDVVAVGDKWLPTATSEGLHPNTAGHSLLDAGFRPIITQFTV